MTKAELIAEVTAFYTVVGTARETTSSDASVPATIKTYEILVYETGSSEKSKKPVLKSKIVNFIVHNEGEAEEAAYYYDNELVNEVNTDITGDSSLLAINKIYISNEMRKRVQAAVAKTSQDILNEALTTSNLSSDASSGQKNVAVVSSTAFWVGKQVVISDTLTSETGTIAEISGNTLIMAANLTNSYTTANSAKVTFADNKERVQWAANAMLNPDTYTLAMTCFVALNPTIQANGGLATDNDIQFVVNSYVSKLSVASYT
ncbi:MAG: hypothetical protein PHF86_04405 [Candidatus Nanoarchaeia archaeon]|jgi:hypothetical protein|nr:hypothetical protein [Candidatus Nanoarchaeia archaeon]